MTGTVTEFLAQHGRLPRLGDPTPPWAYRGWLLWYVQALHESPAVDFPDRWGYLQTVHAAWGPGETTGLDPGPIPQVVFGDRDTRVLSDLTRAVEIAGDNRYGWGWDSFRVFLDWLAFGFGLIAEPPKLSPAAAEKLYTTFNLQPWLERPYDYLAAYICEQRGTGWNPHAFYPTPHPVCEAMVAMTMHDSEASGADNRRLSACDPCCGTGRMLLHMSNHVLYLHGQDIDGIMVRCTLLNGVLYAPWIVAPPPAKPSSELLLPPPPTRASRRA